jgi:hypothetical protein
MLAGLIQMLQDDATVSSFVGDRVYRAVLPRGFVFPALVVHKYANVQDYQLSGPVDVAEDHVQIDVYGNTPAELDDAADAVRALLINYSGTLPDDTVVQGTFLDRDMDLPYRPDMDKKGFTYRSVLGSG